MKDLNFKIEKTTKVFEVSLYEPELTFTVSLVNDKETGLTNVSAFGVYDDKPFNIGFISDSFDLITKCSRIVLELIKNF